MSCRGFEPVCTNNELREYFSANGHITECYIYMNAHYFTRRECISFNRDGWIGFAGWADDGNTNPLRRAFLAWCDYLAEGGGANGKG